MGGWNHFPAPRTSHPDGLNAPIYDDAVGGYKLIGKFLFFLQYRTDKVDTAYRKHCDDGLLGTIADILWPDHKDPLEGSRPGLTDWVLKPMPLQNDDDSVMAHGLAVVCDPRPDQQEDDLVDENGTKTRIDADLFAFMEHIQANEKINKEGIDDTLMNLSEAEAQKIGRERESVNGVGPTTNI